LFSAFILWFGCCCRKKEDADDDCKGIKGEKDLKEKEQ